jgi:hypothetical protein
MRESERDPLTVVRMAIIKKVKVANGGKDPCC